MSKSGYFYNFIVQLLNYMVKNERMSFCMENKFVQLIRFRNETVIAKNLAYGEGARKTDRK